MLVSMPSTQDLFHLATQYHRALPERIRTYLNGRGIPNSEIDRRVLGWNGVRITIPVFDKKGICAFFRLAKDPDDSSDAPKMLSLRGSHIALYGWETLRLEPQRVLICEGEFDRLVLEANGFPAVTSTGGAATFIPEWADAFSNIPEVYVCFDRDPVGYEGMMGVGRLIARAKLIELPEEVGDSGDVTDFFVRLGKTGQDFEELLATATSVSAPDVPPESEITGSEQSKRRAMREEIDRLKREVPIQSVIEPAVELRPSGSTLVGLCPFHEDHRPSFTVFPSQGTFYCFGCRAHGDALTFLQKAEHLSFFQALDVLRQLQSRNDARPE
jgi:DNA primase